MLTSFSLHVRRLAAFAFGLAVLGLAAIAAPATATPAAGQQGQPSLAVTTVDAAAYPQITAVVTALDANGVPVSGLTAANFQAFEAETPLTIDGLQAQRLSLSVALVIDVSGSMQGDAIVAARNAAKEFVQNLAPEDSASIFAFSTAVRQVSPFTADKAQLTDAIDSLQAAGDTSLFEAAQTALFAVNQTTSPRKAVVLMTDGENVSPSPVTADGSLGVARDAGVPVYSIGFGPGPDTTYLQAIAQTTNGQYRAADAGSVSGVYGDIARLLNSVYTLTLTHPPGDALPGGPSMLRVVADIGGVPAEGSLAFDRPGAVIAPTPATSSDPAAIADDDSSGTPLLVYGSFVGAVVVGLMALGGATVFQRARTRRRQLAVVAPNIEHATAQPLPQVPGAILTEGDHGAGRLIALDDESAAYDFTSAPINIGSGGECAVRLPAAPEIAHRHASVWMRDGKIMLRHTTGARRPTLVGGKPVDWVILEHGDEFVIGAHRFRAELA